MEYETRRCERDALRRDVLPCEARRQDVVRTEKQLRSRWINSLNLPYLDTSEDGVARRVAAPSSFALDEIEARGMLDVNSYRTDVSHSLG